MAKKARNVQIIGVNMELTPSLREYVEGHLGRLKNLLSEATSVIVRLCGPKKSGYAPKIQVEAHFKGKTIPFQKYFSREHDGDFSFYFLINVAMKSWMQALVAYKGRAVDSFRRRQHPKRMPAFAPTFA